jgi:cyclopropane-fatty-acyl-phospholipid synthase
MGQHFFTGGMMPSADLLRSIHSDLRVTRQYGWNGQHYQRTAEAWLTNLDANREAALEFLAGVYGPRQSPRWFQRWRIFLLAVAELFGYAKGQEWFVSHYVLEHAAQRARLSVANQS